MKKNKIDHSWGAGSKATADGYATKAKPGPNKTQTYLLKLWVFKFTWIDDIFNLFALLESHMPYDREDNKPSKDTCSTISNWYNQCIPEIKVLWSLTFYFRL